MVWVDMDRRSRQSRDPCSSSGRRQWGSWQDGPSWASRSWSWAVISSPLEAAGRLGKTGIPCATEYSFRTVPGCHPPPLGIESSVVGNVLYMMYEPNHPRSGCHCPAEEGIISHKLASQRRQANGEKEKEEQKIVKVRATVTDHMRRMFDDTLTYCASCHWRRLVRLVKSVSMPSRRQPRA
jgi:hypothetical protein